MAKGVKKNKKKGFFFSSFSVTILYYFAFIYLPPLFNPLPCRIFLRRPPPPTFQITHTLPHNSPELLEESLLIICSLGIQTQTLSPSYLLPASTRFIPTAQIQDIFIHEAFRGFEVRYYLAILVEGEWDVVVVFPVSSLLFLLFFFGRDICFSFFSSFWKKISNEGLGRVKEDWKFVFEGEMGKGKNEKEVYAKSRGRRGKAGRPKSFGTLYLYFRPSHVHTFPPITNLYNHHPSF